MLIHLIDKSLSKFKLLSGGGRGSLGRSLFFVRIPHSHPHHLLVLLQQEHDSRVLRQVLRRLSLLIFHCPVDVLYQQLLGYLNEVSLAGKVESGVSIRCLRVFISTFIQEKEINDVLVGSQGSQVQASEAQRVGDVRVSFQIKQQVAQNLGSVVFNCDVHVVFLGDCFQASAEVDSVVLGTTHLVGASHVHKLKSFLVLNYSKIKTLLTELKHYLLDLSQSWKVQVVVHYYSSAVLLSLCKVSFALL